MLIFLLSSTAFANPESWATSEAYWLDQFQMSSVSAASHERQLRDPRRDDSHLARIYLSLAESQRWAGSSLRQLEGMSEVQRPLVQLCVEAGNCGNLDSTRWLEHSLAAADLALELGLPETQQLVALDVQTRALEALGRIEEAKATNQFACSIDPGASTLFGCAEELAPKER